MASESINWHRLFGLILIDFFTDSPFVVELEKDLSIKKQLLDVVIVRKGEGVLKEKLPDGLESLANHNLITFKSYQETLDDWALKELTSHYVNYRKQVSTSMQELLPEEHFRLYAVSARFPQNLAQQQAAWSVVSSGVYEFRSWDRCDSHRCAPAAAAERKQCSTPSVHSVGGAGALRSGSLPFGIPKARVSLLDRLLNQYRREGVKMPYTMEDFMREYTEEFLEKLTPEQRMKGISAEERVKGLPPEERMKGLPPEERLKGLPSEKALKRSTARRAA